MLVLLATLPVCIGICWLTCYESADSSRTAPQSTEQDSVQSTDESALGASEQDLDEDDAGSMSGSGGSVDVEELVKDESLSSVTPYLMHVGTEAGVLTEVREGEVSEVAVGLLTTYRDGGSCVLASSGYLDLFGSVWGCVVQGDGWVDVCVVSGCDGSCTVETLRLDVDEAKEALVDGETAEDSGE